MAASKRKVVLSVLDKMGVEHTTKISEASAIKKLKRAIDGGEEIPELDKAEIKLLKDLGYDVEIEDDEAEEIEPSDEDLEEIEEIEEIEEEEEEKPAKKKTRKKKSSSKKEAPAKKEKKESAKKEKKEPRVTNQTIVNEMLQEGASEKKIFARLKKVYAEKGKDPENEKDLEWIQGRTEIYIRIGKAQLMID